jgi:hypothetical protein
MAAFMSDHRFQGKILRVGVALERLGIDRQQILVGGVAPAVLRPARLTVNVPILDGADKPPLPGDTGCTVPPGAPFGWSQGSWRGGDMGALYSFCPGPVQPLGNGLPASTRSAPIRDLQPRHVAEMGEIIGNHGPVQAECVSGDQ